MKSVEAVKKFRSINQKFCEVGTKALLGNDREFEHLRGELRVDASSLDAKQLEYLVVNGSVGRRVWLDLRVLQTTTVEDIRKIIFSGLKEMEVLVLRFDATSLEELTPLFQEADSLPNLRSVYWPLQTSTPPLYYIDVPLWLNRTIMADFFQRILSVARNLEEIHNVPEHLLHVINESAKSAVVKSLSNLKMLLDQEGIPYEEEVIDVLEEVRAFGNSSPKLVKLTMHELNVTYPGFIATVQSSKGTLREIRIPYLLSTGLGAQKTEEFPVVPLVSTMDLVTVLRLSECIGLQQFHLSFPNLRKVRINFGSYKCFHHSYGGGHVLATWNYPTVRSLFISFNPAGCGHPTTMDRLMKLFPSIKSVAINWEEFSKNWQWIACLPPQVQRIRLYNFNLDLYQNYGLDALLTGVPRILCKDLQKLKKDAIPFERVRTKPSISSLESKLKTCLAN